MKLPNLFRLEGVPRDAFRLGGGTVAGQVLVLAASPIWSRLYEPEDFGRLGLLLAFINTASVLTMLRFDLAIPMATTQQQADRLLLLCFLVLGPVSLLLSGLLSGMSFFQTFGFGELPPLAGLLAFPLLLATGAFGTLRFWHVARGEYGAIGRSLIAQGAGRALMPILLGLLHSGWWGLAAGELLGRLLGVRSLARRAGVALRFGDDRIRDALRLGRGEYRRFPTVFLPSSLLDAVAAAAPLPVLVVLYDVGAGGTFLLSQQVIAVPTALICTALADVYQKRIIDVARQAPATVGSFFVRSAIRLLLASAAVLMPLGLVAPFLAGPVFGSNWAMAGSMVAILAPSAIISVAASTLSRALVLSRVPQVKLLADAIKLLLPIGGIAAAHALGFSLNWAIAFYSLMIAVSYSIYLVIVAYAIRPHRRIQK